MSDAPAERPGRGHDVARGARYIVLATLLFATMGAVVKHVSADVPTPMIVFFRNLFSVVVLLPWLLRHGLDAIRTTRLPGHLFRATAGLISMVAYFFAIEAMPLGEAFLLQYTAPLFIPLAAWVLLGERASRRVWGAILLGFAGIALILKPGAAVFTPAALLALASGLFSSIAMIGVRRLAQSEPPARIVFYFVALGALLSALPLPWVWQSPEPAQWLTLILVGVIGAAGQLALTRGYACAPATQIGPFMYTAVLFAAGYGWWLWDEVPDRWSAAGAVLVCLAGVWTLRSGATEPQRSRTDG